MSEQQLLDFILARGDFNWVTFQFWSGISFAYIAVSFFAAKHINWFIVVFLSVLYTSITLAVFQMTSTNLELLLAFTNDLRAMSESTELDSQASKVWLERISVTTSPPLMIALFGTYLGALCYLPYNVWKQRGAT